MRVPLTQLQGLGLGGLLSGLLSRLLEQLRESVCWRMRAALVEAAIPHVPAHH